MKTKQILAVIFLCILFLFTTIQSHAQLNLLKDSKTCLYGYTDAAGNWIVPPQFDQAEEFYYHKFAIVTANELSGLMNTEGKIILPLIYSSIQRENEFYFLEQKSGFSVFDYRAEKIIATDIPYKIRYYNNGNAIVYMEKLYGLYSKGNLVARDAANIQFERFGIAKINTGTSDNKKLQLYDLIAGRYITAGTYGKIDVQDSSCFVVCRDTLYGAIDRNEKTIIPFKYNEYHNLFFDTDFCFILTNNTKQESILFNKRGKKLTKKKYSYIQTDERLYAPASWIAEYKNKYTLIDKTGKELLPCIYDSLVLLERADRTYIYFLYSPKGFQIANLDGKILNTGYYPNIFFLRQLYAFAPEYYEDGEENYDYEMNYMEPLPLIISIHADSSITWFDLDTETEYHFPDPDATEENSCSGIIYSNEKYGLISPDMEHILLPTYDFIMPFKTDQTYTTVMNDGLFGIINIEGKTIIEPEHIFIEKSPFSEEAFITKNEDNRWGIISTDNETIIPAEYTAITAYDPELDYFWGIPEESSAWKIMNKDQEVKSALSFDSPVLLSLSLYAIVHVYIPDEDAFKSGVMKCNTLEPLVPYEYAEIQRVNDSIFMCFTTDPIENSAHFYDLYIHAHRIDSVYAVSMLPNNTVAIKRNNAWGYFYGNDWIIAPTPSIAKNSKDHIRLLGMPFIDTDENRDSEGVDEINLFLDTLTTAAIRIPANNKALEVYSDVTKINIMGEEAGSTYTSIQVYDDAYIEHLMEEQEAFETEEFNHWGYNYYESYTTETVAAVILSDQLAEVRYISETYDRHSHYIERANTLYTIKNNTLIPLSLGDVTNHIKGKSMLNKMLLEQLDTMPDIQLPCTDRDDIIGLATAYQFQKDGIHFFYDDERNINNSYEYDEIEVILQYADLVKQFKNAPYLKELYVNAPKE